MEHQKILNLLNEASDSKFMTRNWNIVNDNSKANYGTVKPVQTTTSMRRPLV